MIPGQLRHSVTIQYQAPASPSKDAIGADAYSWATYHATRARIRGIRGREQVAAEAQESLVETEIMIRYYAGVSAGMRVLHGSTYYDIRTVINVEQRNREMLLECTRGNSLG